MLRTLAFVTLLAIPQARAQSSAPLDAYLEQIRADAGPALARCGLDVGLAAPPPPIAVGLRWSAGRVQLEVRGLESVPRAKRAPLLRCLRAVVARTAGSKGALEPVPLELETTAPPPAPFDPRDAHACQSNGDCTIICEDPDDCCSGRCGCSHAVNQAYAARVVAAAKAICKARRTRCSPVGCALEEYSATCVNQRCQARRGTLPF